MLLNADLGIGTAIPKTDVLFLNSILQTFLPGVPISIPSTAQATTTAPPAAVTTPPAPATAPTSTIQAAPANIVPAPDVASQATASSNIPPAVAAPTPQAPPSTPPSTTIVASSSSNVPSAPSTLRTISSSSSASSSSSSSSSSLRSSSSTPSPPAPSSQFSSSSATVSQQSTTPVVVASSTSSADSVAAKTTSSTPSTPPVVQSGLSPLATSTNDGTLSGTSTTTTASSLALIPSSTAAAAESTTSAAAAVTSSGSKVAVGPMVGGILGGFAFIGIVSFILWYLRRRKRRRDSLLTPLDNVPSDMSTSSSADSNREAASPLEKFKAQVGSTWVVVGTSFSNLKSRVKGEQKSGVNMNRGNSQFLERIPQHSRQNSVLSGQQNFVTTKERFGDWADRTKENILFKIRVKLPGKDRGPTDPFADSREKQQTNLDDSDFSQLLAMEQNELQIAAERRRLSLARANEQNQADPFADPTNPFNDPGNVVSPPKPSQPPSSGYMADVRRSRGSRGQSFAQTIGSRYPSTYAPDRDSYGYRDTYMSTASEINGRKNKGRSDPFDLERLRLAESKPPMPYEIPLPPTEPHPSTYAGSSPLEPRVVSMGPSEFSSMGTYSSKYSSIISDFGEPGPDLGSSYNLNSALDSNLNSGAHARQDSDAIGSLMRNLSNGSGRSVGKAL